MSKKQEIVIIGGGAAGLMAAVICGQAGKKVLILEQKEKIGKKILATGNGKCNYTNLKQEEGCYHSKNLTTAMKILNQFSEKETISFFKEIGVFPKIKNGYCYPNSQQASSVVEALEVRLRDLGIKIECNKKVVEVKKKKHEFFIYCGQDCYRADRVIIATGGKASPKLGSDGSGYVLVQEFGHTVFTPLPALTALKCKEPFFKKLAGVRTDGVVSLCWDGKQKIEDAGEIQLTAYGISGIPVFQVSRYGAEGLLQKRKVTACLDFFPGMELEELRKELTRRFTGRSTKTAIEAMTGLLNHKLNAVLLKEAGIELEEKADKIDKEVIKRLAIHIKETVVQVTDTNGFNNAQVTAGGVSLEEINVKTMESLKESGIYLCGEILDVDGICGGYNLQWAWTSGYLAGKGALS